MFNPICTSGERAAINMHMFRAWAREMEELYSSVAECKEVKRLCSCSVKYVFEGRINYVLVPSCITTYT